MAKVAINLNPYQGLKQFGDKACSDCNCCNQPKSLSGIETELIWLPANYNPLQST